MQVDEITKSFAINCTESDVILVSEDFNDNASKRVTEIRPVVLFNALPWLSRTIDSIQMYTSRNTLTFSKFFWFRFLESRVNSKSFLFTKPFNVCRMLWKAKQHNMRNAFCSQLSWFSTYLDKDSSGWNLAVRKSVVHKQNTPPWAKLS